MLDLCPVHSNTKPIPDGLIYLCKMISLTTAYSKFPDSTDIAKIVQFHQRSESDVIVAAGDFRS